MAEKSVIANGINGATGDYLSPELSEHHIAGIAQGHDLDSGNALAAKFKEELDAHQRELRHRHEVLDVPHFGVIAGIDEKDLAQTGWGVIFAYADKDDTPLIREALSELLDHRRRQAGDRYKEYTGSAALRPGESKNKFLARHGMGPGPADPDRIPYYLMIVGSPEAIPYRFQYQLDVQYAVGRLHFTRLEDYAHYARSVVAAETGDLASALPRRAVFFAVKNRGDIATSQSANHLVQPLAEKIAAELPGWEIDTAIKDQASKARLGELLGGGDTPAFLFTASHGIGFPHDDARQLPHQGALVCQDWPGPLQWTGPIPEAHYFSADDIGAEAKLHGMLAFHFACYGAGTPGLMILPIRRSQNALLSHPMLLLPDLPQRLLSHPKGGALAVIGHVERAWTHSFMWQRAGAQTAVFESCLHKLLNGYPVGNAMEAFNERYAEMSTLLSDQLENIKFGAEIDEPELAELWTATNDARAYTIVGDPAVRLPVLEN